VTDPSKPVTDAGPATFYKNMNGTTHVLALPEIAVQAIPEDERIWVPQAPDVWFRCCHVNWATVACLTVWA
jgi:hypothetical protein